MSIAVYMHTKHLNKNQRNCMFSNKIDDLCVLLKKIKYYEAISEYFMSDFRYEKKRRRNNYN